jgi:tetratricopeptide (TPR) repeat protein
MRYRGTQKSLPEIGRELGVDGAVVGSVQRAGDRIRVNAQLIRASTDSQLWTQTYDRDLGDVLRLEGEVARAVAHEIRLELSADDAHRLAGRHINAAAQEAFLRCMYHSWNFNDPDISESIRECEEAVRLQPDFAAAYAGIAQGWSGRVILGFIRPQEGEAPSRDAARKALELGPDLPDSHDAWAMVLSTFDRDFAGAEREEKRALELDPNFVAALNDYSYILIGVDRLSEATALIEHAIALDPFNSALHVTYGLALTGQRRYTEAAQQYQRNLELDPKSSFGKASLLFIAEQTRDPQEFLNELEEQARADGRDVRQYAMTGRLYARLGRRADAMLVISNLVKAARPDPFGIASIYAALGDKDHCFEWLAKMASLPRGIRISPLFDNVRSDPRFEESLKRVPGA